MPAKRWDSYRETLNELLIEFRPKFVLEFGPGFSTEIIATFDSVEQVESVEHDRYFYNKLTGKYINNVKWVLHPDINLYAQHKPSFIPDFIFVDGRNRSRCLRETRRYRGLYLLHDSGREEYQEAIKEFNYYHFTDDGNTCTLTDRNDYYERILKCLKSLQ